MNKFLTLILSALVAVNAYGARVLYNQNFEAVSTPADAGWTYGGTSMDIISDEFGKFLRLSQGQSNGRSGSCIWDPDIYKGLSDILNANKYQVWFDFSPHTAPNNQYNCGLTVMSNCRVTQNQPFSGRWTNAPAEGQKAEGYLFDLYQVKRDKEDTQSIQFMVNGNEKDLIVMDSGWYTIDLSVDVKSRTVEYSITNMIGDELTSGRRTVPAKDFDGTEISMLAEGLWAMLARYNTVFYFDNISVRINDAEDFANVPACSLVRVGKDQYGRQDLNHRAYRISFYEFERLHITGTDGKTTTVDYYDCDGEYEYVTTTSGTLTVWTTYGSATSDKVTVNVDCTPVRLPQAKVTLTDINGDERTYRLTVDNADVLLKPEILIDCSFAGDDGSNVYHQDLATGSDITVVGSGMLTVTSKASGYQPNTVEMPITGEYVARYEADFARMTRAQIMSLGFRKYDDLNSSVVSGENNWTGRRRLYYYDINSPYINDDKETAYAIVYPFGYTADDDTTHLIHRWLLPADQLTPNKAASMWSNIEIWTGSDAMMYEHIGLLQMDVKKTYSVVKVKNCSIDDIVTINTISDYGADSYHPIVGSVDEYYAGLKGTDKVFIIATASRVVDDSDKSAESYVVEEPDGTYTLYYKLYRIDTALTKVTVSNLQESRLQAPVISLNGTTVTITAKSGAQIYYTVDGSEPSTASTKYTKPFTVDGNCTVKAIAVKDGSADSEVAALVINTLRVAKPTITFRDATVTITAEAGARIYYTLNGSEPTEASTLYTAPFSVDGNCTVKAIAVKDGWIDSEVTTYTIEVFRAESPTVSYNGRYVTLEVADPDATVHYTLDGSAPTSRSQNYTGAFDAGGAVTVSAVAVKPGFSDSEVTVYNIPAYYDGETATVAVADSLSVAFGWTDAGAVVRLSVRGQLGEADWQTMRSMSALRSLDLSEADMEYISGGLMSDMAIVDVSMPRKVRSMGNGIFSGCKSLCAVTWNAETPLTSDAMAGFDNPNLLLYVSSASLAPANVTNVIADGQARNITVTDGYRFWCPAGFRATRISYTHSYTQDTPLGGCAGWETLTLPFSVQAVSHEAKGQLRPFAAQPSDAKPFWLYRMGDSGFEPAAEIVANTPYLVSFPNNSIYEDDYNVPGAITFESYYCEVPATSLNVCGGAVKMVPCLEAVPASNAVYALNIYDRNITPGSRFISNLRAVNPFEAYLSSGSTAMRVSELKVGDMLCGDVSGIVPTAAENLWSVSSHDGVLYISTGTAETVALYTAGGALVRMLDLKAGVNTVSGLPAGIYIIKGTKVIVD